jgi:hypothetical protein
VFVNHYRATTTRTITPDDIPRGTGVKIVAKQISASSHCPRNVGVTLTATERNQKVRSSTMAINGDTANAVIVRKHAKNVISSKVDGSNRRNRAPGFGKRSYW